MMIKDKHKKWYYGDCCISYQNLLMFLFIRICTNKIIANDFICDWLPTFNATSYCFLKIIDEIGFL